MHKIALNTSNIIIILLPISLITGAFVSDLSVVLLNIFFIYLLWKEKKFFFLDDPLFKYLMVFYFFISIRSLFSDDIFLSSKNALLYFRFIIFAFAISFFLDKTPSLKTKFFISCCVCFLILIVDSYVQFINGKNLLGWTSENNDKLNSLFGSEAIMGSYILKLLPIFLALFISCLDIKKNPTYFSISLLLIISLVFLSGSRASLYLLILFIILLFIYIKEIRKNILISFILCFATILIIANFNNQLKVKLLLNFKDPIQRVFNIGGHTIQKESPKLDRSLKKIKFDDNLLSYNKIIFFSKVHHSHYLTGLNMFYNNILFGQGTKMFRVLCKDDKYRVNKHSCSTHPHNYYIQLLAENGIIGFLFIFLVFLKITYFLFKKLIQTTNDKITNSKSLIVLLGIYVNIWPLVPTGNFFNNYLSITIYLPIGFFLYFKMQNKKGKNA